MDVLVVSAPVTPETLAELSAAWHHTLVKGVADIGTGMVALGGEWHMDANVRLIAEGASQQNLWGFNLYPDKEGSEAIEYISLINIRPREGNRSMEIESEDVREKVRATVAAVVPFLNL